MLHRRKGGKRAPANSCRAKRPEYMGLCDEEELLLAVSVAWVVTLPRRLLTIFPCRLIYVHYVQSQWMQRNECHFSAITAKVPELGFETPRPNADAGSVTSATSTRRHVMS